MIGPHLSQMTDVPAAVSIAYRVDLSRERLHVMLKCRVVVVIIEGPDLGVSEFSHTSTSGAPSQQIYILTGKLMFFLLH